MKFSKRQVDSKRQAASKAKDMEIWYRRKAKEAYRYVKQN